MNNASKGAKEKKKHDIWCRDNEQVRSTSYIPSQPLMTLPILRFSLLSRRVVYSILHRILYFLPVRGEGSLLVVEEREKRMIILCMVGIVYIHNYMGRTDHAVSCAQTMFGHAWQPKAALPSRCSDGSYRIIGCGY